ncbi:MAG: hypothetical protein M9897_08835 [Brumimicrobium sp.]|nr:hypothetical protein [Brumimicrobium sp.]
MKIFCSCNICNSRIYLASTAQSRHHLASNFGMIFTISCTNCHSKNQIHVNLVTAESSYGKTSYVTAAGGGLMGIVAGPLGILIGVVIGGAAGGFAVSKEKEAVRRFNNNYL